MPITVEQYNEILNSNFAEGQYLAAVAYGRGEKDVPQDMEKAQKLMRRSAELGYQPAKDFLKRVGEY